MKGKAYEEIRAAQEEAEPLALHYGRLIARFCPADHGRSQSLMAAVVMVPWKT
ncbi:hypothetical protein [Streptomyces erythrochromogenes]|uniref:hypothetical protein n=1 Tax=Streptomyces erythrochromogenes TaxID=285574 RepID=UPI0038144757